MGTSELLRRAVEILDRLQLRYFVTGSMASIFYGEPRFTNDIDIVVDLPLAKVDAFCQAFPADEYYVSADSARQAVLKKRQFNIIHPASGLKVDVMLPSNPIFDASRFQRSRNLSPAPGLSVRFASPEDVILKKLEFFRDGGSDKHLRDIRGMLRISRTEIDREYLQSWSQRLDVAEIWDRIEER